MSRVHELPHPMAGRSVIVRCGDKDPVEYRLEDWWDRVVGRSWMESRGNPAALGYASRSALDLLPFDDEVVYGKIGDFGYLVHVSEIIDSDVVPN